MMQLIIEDFEEGADYESEIFDSEGLIKHLYGKGYYWLTDLASGNVDEPYIPYRVQFPTGKILDEKELFFDFSELEKVGFSKEEIKEGRLLYYSINHENTNKDRYKFCNYTFVSDKDRVDSIKKYKENPFY